MCVELFEARRRLGGRATCFECPETADQLDNCQHVAMGCCTNFTDFCERAGIADAFVNYDRLHFFGPDGKRYDFHASNWLPTPLHLAPAFLRHGYLTLWERTSIGRAIYKLARTRVPVNEDGPTIGEWLVANGQSEQAIKRFWEVVLVSALAESLEHASLSAARKVFVDGFLRARKSFHLQVPTIPLQDLYDRVQTWLEKRSTTLHLGTSISSIKRCNDSGGLSVRHEGRQRAFDFVIAALPWRRVSGMLPAQVQQIADSASQIESSPITSLHLWFDRELTKLPHAVLVDRLSQWVFARPEHAGAPPRDEYYYQVIISASRGLAGRDRQAVRNEVVADLQHAFPAACDAKLLRWQMITEQHAVFSVRRGIEKVRPAQLTEISNLMLAGDWTQTGWPATMEGAVRSGYLAAEAVLGVCGQPASILVPDLPVSWLSALLGLAP